MLARHTGRRADRDTEGIIGTMSRPRFRPFDPYERYAFTAAQVMAMVDSGVLESAEEYELLEGELIRVAAKGPLHALIATRLNRRLERALPEGFHAQKAECVAGDENSLPEPDVAIVRGEVEDYRDRLPEGRDVILAIEVSVSTYERDRAKLPIYARAGVATVWILDVERRRLEVHTDNRGDRFARSWEHVDDEAIEVPVLGERWTVASLID